MYAFSFAQQPVSIQLTEKDGLPDIEFYDMIEDQQGFMWFAANKGLYRYDGREFKNYTHPNKRGLSVFGLQFDQQNRLWCTNISGQFFYIENDSLKLFFDISKNLKETQKLYEFNIYNNKLFIYASKKIISIDLKTKKIIDHSEKLSHKFIFHNRGVIRNDTLFIPTGNRGQNSTTNCIGIITKNNPNLSITNTVFNSNYYSLYTLNKYKKGLLHTDRDGNVHLSNNYRNFNTIKIADNLNPLLFNGINFLDNKLWLLANNGALLTTIDSTNTLTLQSQYFKSIATTEVVKDKNENYWFSTLHNGIYVIPNINLLEYPLKKDIGTLSAIEIIDKNNIAFGSIYGWVGMYNTKTKQTNYFQTKEKRKINKLLYDAYFNKLHISSEGEKNSYIYDFVIKKLINITKSKLVGAKSLLKINDTTLFYGGSSRGNLKTLKNKGVYYENKPLKNRRELRIYDAYYDTNNEDLYVGYVDQLTRFDKGFNRSFITHNNNPIFTRSITKTDNDIIWVSTFTDGVLGIKNDSVIKIFNTKNGLLSNQTTIVRGDGDDLWIVTEKGIQLLNTANNTFKNLTKKDGIDSYNIIDLKIADNTIWFISNLGLFSAQKDKIFKKQTVAEPYFTSVSIADSIHPLQKKYNLNYSDKKIKIGFNATGFKSSENTQYLYKLKGLNNEWESLTKGINEVTYNSLPQGNYTFQIKTIEGNQSSTIKELQFNVKGALYKRPWFIAISAITLISLVILYYRRLIRKQKEKEKIATEQQQNELEKTLLKLENLRSQMNPHFVFNALNSIQDYIITNEKDLAGDYLGKFADLIRMYLEQSSKQKISLQEEIDTLNQYLELEKLRFEDKLSYKIYVDHTIDTNGIEIPTMLIQPYVENALKHGLLHKKNKGNLSVNITKNSDKTHLICTIIDDGVGRERAIAIKKKQFKPYKSFATKATQNRVELLNYNKANKITVVIENLNDNKIYTGTKVTLKIPVDF